MTVHDTRNTPSGSSPAHKPTINIPPITPISKPPQLKARTPSNRFLTYKECLANDNAARYRAKSLVKESDQYIFEMDHQKREQMLEAAAEVVDAMRIKDGEHVSCLFEEAQEIEETPLSPEEAAEKWETTKREIAAKHQSLKSGWCPKRWLRQMRRSKLRRALSTLLARSVWPLRCLLRRVSRSSCLMMIKSRRYEKMWLQKMKRTS